MVTARKGKGASGRFQVRFDADEKVFISRKAKEHGKSVSTYLREKMVVGILAENVESIEQRLSAFLEKIEKLALPDQQQKIPENILQSIYTSEELLTAIVEARDPQQLYDAQDRAKARIKREKGE